MELLKRDGASFTTVPYVLAASFKKDAVPL
ncbi:hypothetical protein MELB17_06279 [Marinobacter sp. ELB17]|nr:hypothetical protein MELB17_06279 [Marinobacter sp. ELB17]